MMSQHTSGYLQLTCMLAQAYERAGFRNDNFDLRGFPCRSVTSSFSKEELGAVNAIDKRLLTCLNIGNIKIYLEGLACFRFTRLLLLLYLDRLAMDLNLLSIPTWDCLRGLARKLCEVGLLIGASFIFLR